MKKLLLIVIIILSVVVMFGQKRIDGAPRVRLVEDIDFAGFISYQFDSFENKWISGEKTIKEYDYCGKNTFIHPLGFIKFDEHIVDGVVIRRLIIQKLKSNQTIGEFKKYGILSYTDYYIISDKWVDELYNFLTDKSYNGKVLTLFMFEDNTIINDKDNNGIKKNRNKYNIKFYKTTDGKSIRFYLPYIVKPGKGNNSLWYSTNRINENIHNLDFKNHYMELNQNTYNLINDLSKLRNTVVINEKPFNIESNELQIITGKFNFNEIGKKLNNNFRLLTKLDINNIINDKSFNPNNSILPLNEFFFIDNGKDKDKVVRCMIHSRGKKVIVSYSEVSVYQICSKHVVVKLK